jgi:hypothetical protein
MRASVVPDTVRICVCESTIMPCAVVDCGPTRKASRSPGSGCISHRRDSSLPQAIVEVLRSLPFSAPPLASGGRRIDCARWAR